MQTCGSLRDSTVAAQMTRPAWPVLTLLRVRPLTKDLARGRRLRAWETDDWFPTSFPNWWGFPSRSVRLRPKSLDR